MFDYPGRERFVNAPLEFVAAEVRFPFAPRLGQDATLDAFVEAVREEFPVPAKERIAAGLQLTFGAGTPAPKPVDAHTVLRCMNRRKTRSVVVSPSSMVLETTDYEDYEDFRQSLEHVVSAIAGLNAVVGVERLGLRYIDELRVPDHDGTVAAWRPWVAAGLLASLDVVDGYDPETAEGVIRVRTGVHSQVLLRYATLVGSGVVNDTLKKRRTVEDGPFFVIDIDSSWANDDEISEFSVDWTCAEFDKLHEPTGSIFLQTVSERYKREIARRRPND